MAAALVVETQGVFGNAKVSLASDTFSMTR
jgi:hypothetical protein